ncbi:aminopeptidase N [Micrococcus flavus]|uniref:Aminopeptidase N n=1 Tax=Micrococcus flavus TaxID=384602 RepID=A0A4Y8X459_9MICC|nr:aminopeptidase N [Micrococcus flavus]MBB4882677.1 aminopeptidase N [Micrococcus flavus]TFI04145.1 aminopeptidase N [Micrococcus flavus]GGK39364.1 aminopeptidase [Micrococcus flavus]
MSDTPHTPPSSAPATPGTLDDAALTREDARSRAAAVRLTAESVHVDLSDVRDEDARTFPVSAVLHVEVLTDGTDLRVDFLNDAVTTVAVDGRALDASAVAGRARILVPDLSPGAHEVRIEGRALYSRSGEGLHRFVDPADGEVYLYTQYEPADARRVFPTLEQPDLKTAFTFSLTGPEEWILASNRPEASRTPAGEGLVRVDFEPTLPQSGYITGLLAGPYAVWEDVWDGHTATGAPAVPLRLLCRRTLAEHLDAEALFALTRSGLDLFHDLFGVAYPWGKYDQVFVPEYNLGAMENPGLVTFTEDYVFTSHATEAQREGRANTVLHEMAHMWFGDLVTMRWWDDLWLKESFADLMGTLAVDEATDFDSSWVSFASRRKAWAYVQDALPTTHPIVADIPDLEAARQNFDGITYAKGASVLKQLMAYAGRDAFLAASRLYFERHAWGNAELADFLAVLGEASGRDMGSWAQAWLHTAGVPVLRVDLDGDVPALVQSGVDPTTGETVLRPHAVRVGVYTPGADGTLERTGQVAVDVADGDGGARTPLPGLEVPADGPRLVLPNDDDLTYAALDLDAASVDAVLAHPIADPLAEATVWAALWSMVRDGRLPVIRFLEAVTGLSAGIETVGVHTQVLAQAGAAVGLYARAQDRAALRTRLGAALEEQVRTLPPGSDRQRTAARTWAVLARQDAAQALRVEEVLLGGEATAPGLAADAELRWLVLQALAAAGHADADRLDQALAAERTAQTVTWHRLALAARPEADVKVHAWDEVMAGRTVEGRVLSNDLLSATAAGFATGPAALTAGFERRFWPELEPVWASRSNGLASRTISGLFPGRQDALDGDAAAQEAHPVLARAQAWLDGHPAAPRALRRLVVEETDQLRRSLRVQAAQPAASSS